MPQSPERRNSLLKWLEEYRTRYPFEVRVDHPSKLRPQYWSLKHPDMLFAFVPLDECQWWLFQSQEDLDLFKINNGLTDNA